MEFGHLWVYGAAYGKCIVALVSAEEVSERYFRWNTDTGYLGLGWWFTIASFEICMVVDGLFLFAL